MESLPLELVSCLAQFRPLMRAEVFDTFSYLLCGLLIGVRLARHGARLGLRPGHLSAATLERSRLVRDALSFSKKLENHIGAIKYFICHYNQEVMRYA